MEEEAEKERARPGSLASGSWAQDDGDGENDLSPENWSLPGPSGMRALGTSTKGPLWDGRGPRHVLTQLYPRQIAQSLVNFSIQSIAKALEPDFQALNPSSVTRKLCDRRQVSQLLCALPVRRENCRSGD